MWEMLDPDLECGNECGGPGPPPEFLVPPPPRPPFLAELVNCNEEQLQQTPFGGGATGSFAEVDMCEAFPIIDASYHSGPSFQTSAMIVLCSGLLLLVIFISSLLVWKHKRKVQNFLPCKTPTRGPPHLDATGVSAAHSVTYEDPDVHLGHHPLVMRHHHHHHHHHNMELHAKQIHYPSGYPMPRSPPLFICSSPGPDPYRSHDNVYEELEHGPGRDTDSEPPIQSDDDFAEDELSLPGDRSFHKSPSDGGTTVATIYHDRSNGGSSNSAGTTASGSTVPVTDGLVGGAPGTAYLERNRTERNSLLSSSSSSGNDNNHPLHHNGHRVATAGGNGTSTPSGGVGSNGGGAACGGGGGGGGVGSGNSQSNNNNGSNSSGSSSASNSNRNSNSSTDCGNNNNNNNNNNNHPGSVANGTNCNGNSVVPSSGGALGLFRTRKHHPATLGGSGRRTGGGGGHPFAGGVANTCTSTLDGGPLGGDPVVLPPMYDDRGMMTLPPPAYNHTLSTSHHHHHPHHGHHSHHLNSVNNNSTTGGRSNYYSTIDDAGELLDPVERRNRINAQLSASASGPIGTVSTIFRNGHRGPVAPSYGVPPSGGGRSRTNPRASDRRTGGRNGNGNQLAVISTPQDPSQYIYHEPVFHEGLIYDGCLSHTYSDRSGGSGSTGTGSTGGVAYHPYILPQFTTFRNGSVPGIVGGGGGSGGGGGGPPSSHPAGHSIYSRDSSFGSDSGYSQHTQTSNRSVAGWSQRRPTGQSTTSSNGSGNGGGSGVVATVPQKATNVTEQQPSSAPPTMVDS